MDSRLRAAQRGELPVDNSIVREALGSDRLAGGLPRAGFVDRSAIAREGVPRVVYSLQAAAHECGVSSSFVSTSAAGTWSRTTLARRCSSLRTISGTGCGAYRSSESDTGGFPRRYPSTRPIILASDLVKWLESLPTEAPGFRWHPPPLDAVADATPRT